MSIQMLVRSSSLTATWIPASVDSEEKGMKVMSEIESVLEKRGFKMKYWTFSGQKSKREKSVLPPRANP